MKEESSSVESERKAVRPWYRSRLIWLGIPGLLFLIWASLGNPNRFGMLELQWGEHSVAFMDRHLMLQIQVRIPKAGPLGPFVYGYVKPTISRPLGEPPGRFPPAMKSMGWYSGRRGSSGDVSIAYWFLTVVYLAMGSGALALWQWRKVRLAKRRLLEAIPEGEGSFVKTLREP